MIIPLLNTANTNIKLLKNTVLGSITRVDNEECIEMSPQIQCSQSVTRHMAKHS